MYVLHTLPLYMIWYIRTTTVHPICTCHAHTLFIPDHDMYASLDYTVQTMYVHNPIWLGTVHTVYTRTAYILPTYTHTDMVCTTVHTHAVRVLCYTPTSLTHHDTTYRCDACALITATTDAVTLLTMGSTDVCSTRYPDTLPCAIRYLPTLHRVGVCGWWV